jgi:dynamin 1-like protein
LIPAEYSPYHGDDRVPENYSPSTSNGGRPAWEWVEFNHNAGVKYFDFKEVQQEIQRETDRLTGKNVRRLLVGVAMKGLGINYYW